MVPDRPLGALTRSYTRSHSALRRTNPLRWPRGFVSLLLACALIALIPAAHAAPPDPTWMSGIYDGGDYDEVVLLVTFLASLADEGRFCAQPPFPTIRSTHPATRTDIQATETYRTTQPRAPPQT